MSANKRRRSNSESSRQMATADCMSAAKDVRGGRGIQHSTIDASVGDGVVELLQMPRVCRCCCKGDMELLGLFEASVETAKQTTQTQRRRKTTTIEEAAATTTKTTAAQQEPQQRKSDNPVEYALSGAHSSMDIVLEEMIIWMLNISRDDGLPQEICRQCKAQFIMVAKFRRRCMRVQQRLEEYAKEIAERKRWLAAKQVEQPQQNETSEEYYLHLPESQIERKRRLVLSKEAAQLVSQPKQAKTEAETEAGPRKLRRLHLRLRNMRIASLPASQIETEQPTRSASQQGELKVRSPLRMLCKKMHMPWKTKAARKQLSETWSSCSTASHCRAASITPEELTEAQLATPPRAQSSDTETETSAGQTSPEQLSDLSVNPCHGFASDCPGWSPPSSISSVAMPAIQDATTPKPIGQLQFPPKQETPKKQLVVLRRGRRGRSSVPLKRAKRIAKKKKKQASARNHLSKQKMEQASSQPKEQQCEEILAAGAEEQLTSSSSDEKPCYSQYVQSETTTEDLAAATTDEEREKPGESAAAAESDNVKPTVTTSESMEQLEHDAPEQLQSPDATEYPAENATNETQDKRPTEEMQSISKKVNETQEQMAVDVTNPLYIHNGTAETADSTVQSEELTSSTMEHSQPIQGTQCLSPEVPASECEIELRITNDEQPPVEEPVQEAEEPASELIVSIPLDVLGDELQRKLCSSAEEEEQAQDAEPKEPTEADDVNNNENSENFCQSATADSFNAAVALTTKQIEAEPNGGKAVVPLDDDMESLERLAEMQPNAPVAEVQPLRAVNASSMDFLAEFEKHCEKTLKLQAKAAPLETKLELVEAKQQLEVEMNDVESTLHGILNEMQDQHLYTPVCTPIDEFLTPADYVPLSETETPAATPTAPQLYASPAETPQGQVPPQQQQQVKEGNLFDSSNFSNELIGFQNDMPCFENIEATPESMAAQQSLQLELTQLLNELQPAQQQSAQQQQPLPQQQQLQLQQEAVNYEALYQAPLTAPSPVNGNKLQIIQMQPQETLWQAQATTAQQTTTTQLQWSTVGGLEAIKTTPVAGLDSLDGSGTTTYYINASDLYQTQLQQQPAQLTGDSYAILDSNENYVLEQQQQQQQQPIMILIQQPELQQPVASASNPQQAPLHITYGTSLGNELHAYPQQQLQQPQQQQQQEQRTQQKPQQQKPHSQSQQQVQNTVLGLPPAVPPPTRGRPPLLKCRFCQNGPRFSNSLEYSRHIIELHPAVAPFNCPHCPLAFAGRSKRSQHILNHHMVQQFHCGQCSLMLPSQRALDLHLQRFHMPLPTESTASSEPAAGAVRLDEVQLQIANKREFPKLLQQKTSPHMPALDLETSLPQPRRTRILCCPDCEDCSSGHSHGSGQSTYEELTNLQPPPTVLTPPSTIASVPSPQPTPHITLPSPEQSEPDSTTATLRQFRKRCVANCSTGATTPIAAPTAAAAAATMLTTAASPSPSSSPSSSTMETSVTLQLGKLSSSHQCVICEKRFTNIIALRKHQQLAHDSQTSMPWVCSICKRGYRKRTDMDNHMKSHEPKGRPYECNECWVRFPEFKQLAMHKFTVHELIKPHTCDECGKQFGTESALKTHIKFHGAHINTHLPLGVFLNDKMPSSVSSKIENPSTPATTEESLPLTPLSSCNGNGGSIEDCPGSVELVESSVAPSLDMIVNTP